ncbi:MAG: hypothetical protein KatS3mg121_0136 [Gammaproteobacteria bacterium]|nr:MAG: hypothetical protein KatS3mg121_0136 [Gammaproteobacteria bacterium]
MDFGWDDLDLSGNLGLRWVNTRSTASWLRPQGPNLSSYPAGDPGRASASTRIPVSIVHDYSNSLPSLNLRWEPVEGLVTRLALSKNIYRPDFSDMQAFTQLYVNTQRRRAPNGSTDVSDYNGSASGGNPRLQPMEADQVDLSLEWYYADVGSAWLTLFQKDYSNFLRDRVFEESYNGFVYNVTRPDNQEGATIDGWELGWRHFFDWGFGVEASYTRIDSSAEVDEETLPLDTDGTPFDPSALPVEGLSEKQYTLTLMYENARVSTRLAYTWRSAFLVDIGPNGFNGNNGGIAWRLPVFQDDYGQWDGSVFFNLSERFAIGLEANNLTNERLDLVQHQINPGNHLATSTVQDTRYALTFKGRF